MVAGNLPMAIERLFLDWRQPPLPVAAEFLRQRFATSRSLDLGDVIVAVPSGRAQRRLLEILVDLAERTGLAFVPPSILTVGRLPEQLYQAKRPFADDLTQQLAWIEAIRGTDSPLLERLIPSPPADDDLMAWLALGEMLGRLHRELAAEGLDFLAVANCGDRITGFREQARWEALAAIQQRYLEVLDGLELWDLQTARLFAIQNGECHTDARVVLIGAVDLNRQQQLILDQIVDRVTTLVFAPETIRERFDEYGRLRAAAWRDVEIPLREEQIEVVDDPADQATAVAGWMESLGGRFAAEEVALGVPDERLVPYIRQRLEECGIAARHGVGLPLSRFAPYRLLSATADYLDGRRFDRFASLVRHPPVHEWLLTREIEGHWLNALDRYQAEHLPRRLGGRWLGRSRDARLVRRVYQEIEGLLQSFDEEKRPLADWGEPIARLLVDVFGGTALDREHEPDRSTVIVCDKLRGVLIGHQDLRKHESKSGPWRVEAPASEALRLVLRGLSGEAAPALPDREAVEMLGWLDLPLDDAPAVVVTQFNEGIVPASLNADLFLPNQLRHALGVEDNDRRYARDAYSLSLLAASRRELKLIVGRRSAEGDPLAPSRLLFACDGETAARRARRFFAQSEDHKGASPRLVFSGGLRPGQTTSTFEVPRPRALVEPVRSMRVTEFRDFLACPYRYYLRHCLKLGGLDDAAEELDGGAFGSLAHEVLGEFGAGRSSGETDAERIGQLLDESLDRIVADQFGSRPVPALRVQVEQLRIRLARFAQWQADWAAEGWRIEHVETSPAKGEAFIKVDGDSMFLRGRIDRIDIHPATGRRIVFDYKTSDTRKTPKQAHQKAGVWIDLQLPLYRRLIAGLGIEGPVELGYICLPKDTSRTGHLLAEWSDEDLDDADLAAEEVVRRVRNSDFWPRTEPPPNFFEEFAVICQDNLLTTRDE